MKKYKEVVVFASLFSSQGSFLFSGKVKSDNSKRTVKRGSAARHRWELRGAVVGEFSGRSPKGRRTGQRTRKIVGCRSPKQSIPDKIGFRRVEGEGARLIIGTNWLETESRFRISS